MKSTFLAIFYDQDQPENICILAFNCPLILPGQYSDGEKLEKFRLLGYLWDEREKVIDGIIMEQSGNEGFSVYPGAKDTMYLKIDEKISFAYDQKLAFGFICTPNAKGYEKKWEALKEVLENKRLKNIFTDSPAVF